MHVNGNASRLLNALRRAVKGSRGWAWLAAAAAAATVAAFVTATAPSVLYLGPEKPSAADRPLSCGPPTFFIPCYTPKQFEVAYGVQPLLSRGINGSGQTVVMPELLNAPGPDFTDIRRDLAAFDSRFGLPPARLRVLTTLAPTTHPYVAGAEEVEDTEIVHAIAPDATLDVVLAPSNAQASPANFAAALTNVMRVGIAQHASVISISASGGEYFLTRAAVAGMNAVLEQARARHVTVVASSGDGGAISDLGPPRQVSLPASDPLVLGVGGTSLNADSRTGAYDGEMAWNELTDATGGGFSHLFPRPSYQDGIPGIAATRGVPDVAANADSRTAMAMDFTGNVFEAAHGTSAATPLWAAVIALADQEAGHHLGFVNAAIYQIARSPAYHRAFHDVITGNNSVMVPKGGGIVVGYQAAPGWDPVTGWGSPDAQVLVPLLARSAAN
jgi:subtilase family serine protease